MSAVLSPPQYSPQKFINREEELERLDDLIRPGRSRAIVFRGERGVGKTWLPAHWEWLQRKQRKNIILRIDLKKYWGKDLGWVISDLLDRVNQEIVGQKGPKIRGATLSEKSRSLIEHFRSQKPGKPLILILDHVYESEWDLLRLLEEYVLAPLIAEPGVYIVLTGRGKPYPWMIPALAIQAELIDVKPFDSPKKTEEQIERQAPEGRGEAGEIHELTGGNPLANYLLAAESPPARVSDQVIESILEPVPEERREIVQNYIEALCVLRAFDEDRIAEMLAVSTGDESYRKWTFAQARQVRDELIRWALAEWDTEQRAYVLDRIVRQLMEAYLRQNKPKKWEELHQAAIRLYERWAEEYSTTRERWQEEAKYHKECLESQRKGEAQ